MSTDKTPTQRLADCATMGELMATARELAAELERAQDENKRAMALLDEVQADALEQARLLGKSGSREAALLTENATLRHQLAEEVKGLDALREDKAMLDWLADRNNAIGEVCLPAEFVTPHLDDMRAAIRAAMKQTEGKR